MPVYAGAPWIPKFKGIGGDTKFNDWKEQIQGLLQAREFSEAQKVSITLGALADEAKREVCVLGETQRDTVAKILAYLESLYGDQVPVATLRSQFFSCIQSANESLRSFVLRLRELFCRLQRRDSDSPLSEGHLQDQLLMGIHNADLRRTVKTFARRNPEKDFNAVLEEMFLLEREQRPGSMSESLSQAVGESSASSSLTGKDDWMETFRKEILQEVKGQMNMWRQEMTRQSHSSVSEPTRHPQHTNQPTRHVQHTNQPTRHLQHANQPPPRRRVQSYSTNDWDSEGRPICHRCGRVGHMARFCRPPSESNAALN